MGFPTSSGQRGSLIPIDIYRLGTFNCPSNSMSYQAVLTPFALQLNVPFEKRWLSCKIRTLARPPPSVPQSLRMVALEPIHIIL